MDFIEVLKRYFVKCRIFLNTLQIIGSNVTISNILSKLIEILRILLNSLNSGSRNVRFLNTLDIVTDSGRQNINIRNFFGK